MMLAAIVSIAVLLLACTLQDVKLKDGRVIHYGAPGCSPTPPLTSNFWAASLPAPAQAAPGVSAAGVGAPRAPFSTAALSAYTTVAPSIKGGVGVPVGSDTWLANQVRMLPYDVPILRLSRPLRLCGANCQAVCAPTSGLQHCKLLPQYDTHISCLRAG
jgi:hypothetical protein